MQDFIPAAKLEGLQDAPTFYIMYGSRPYGRQDRGTYQQNIDQQLASQEKKTAHRRTVDHGNNMGRWHLQRSLGITDNPTGKIRPESTYLMDLLPAPAYASWSVNLNRGNPAVMDVHTKFVHLSANKAKHSIQTVKWTPEGRRLLVASHSGEFTIWNGMTFNFETIMQAHDLGVFALQYTHNGDWLLSGDQVGGIKYWQPNFNNVNIINGHSDGIRDIAFLPNDAKFLTASDDSTMKIWSFSNGREERTLAGHHWDVKSADWHPSLGLIVSGSKDNLVKLWDPRAAQPISTLHGHKHTVTKTRFQTAGTCRLLATAARDRSCRVFDLRTMRDFLVIRDPESDLSCVAWHPQHACMLTTGANDGSMSHYLLDTHIAETDSIKTENSTTGSQIEAVHRIPYAHEKAINALEYHPLGHLLCSAGADRSARFWSRARPNDPMSFKDALYTNDKVGAWYYGVNNNINAVLEDTGAGGSSAAPAAPQQLPGLNNFAGAAPARDAYAIPGLRGH